MKLASDGFSYHTFELRRNPPDHKFWKVFQSLKEQSQHKEFYSFASNCYYCGILRRCGILIYLTKTEHQNVVKLVVNPRRLLDPDASYLGIMPPGADAFEQMEQDFTDCMRKVGLPDFLEDWTLSRLDLCVNIICNKKKGPHEVIRLLSREPTPLGCVRNSFGDASSSKHPRGVGNSHIFKLSNNSIDLIAYDKRYHLDKEKLSRPDEILPKGVLRVELRCHKEYIKNLRKKTKLHGTCELMTFLATNSRELICQYARRLYGGGMYYTLAVMKQALQKSKISSKRRRQMLRLAKALANIPDVYEAEKAADLSKKQLRTCQQVFARLDIHPVPLRKDYPVNQIPSLLNILKKLEEDGTELTLHDWKNHIENQLMVFF